MLANQARDTLRRGHTGDALYACRALAELVDQMAEALDEVYADRRELRKEVRELTNPGSTIDDLRAEASMEIEEDEAVSPPTIQGRSKDVSHP